MMLPEKIGIFKKNLSNTFNSIYLMYFNLARAQHDLKNDILQIWLIQLNQPTFGEIYNKYTLINLWLL